MNLLKVLIAICFILFTLLAWEVNKVQVYKERLKDYQIDIYMNSVWVYDNGRLVDRYRTDWGTKLDTIIMNDNL